MVTASMLVSLAAAALVSGCTQTRYTSYEDPKEDGSNPFERTVEFELTGAFYQEAPDCIAVLPFAAEGPAKEGAATVEQALARYLSLKVPRVVGPDARDRLARSLAVDLSTPRGREVFAAESRCAYFVGARPWGGEGVFAVVWSQERAGLELTLTRGRDGAMAWRSRHIATRSEGGVPLSPLSILYNVFSVVQFSADRDVPASVIDDAVRRMTATLPDTRLAAESPAKALPRGATAATIEADPDWRSRLKRK